MKEGIELSVKKVDGGQALSLRLSELGIFEGSKIKVLKNKRGPVILCVFGSTLAIGRGQAKKIEVSK